jgi:P27 family predicted phage terminase small subunit
MRENQLKPDKAPKHLRAAGKALFTDLVDEYGLTDAAGLALLTTASECLDRMRAAQKAISEHGETVLDRYGQVKVNPACTLEKDARNGFLAALRALNLDIEPLRDRPGRPPLGIGWKGE